VDIERLAVHIAILAIVVDNGGQDVVLLDAGAAVDANGLEHVFAADDSVRPIAVDVDRRNLTTIRGLQAGILGGQWVDAAAAELAGFCRMAAWGLQLVQQRKSSPPEGETSPFSGSKRRAYPGLLTFAGRPFADLAESWSRVVGWVRGAKGWVTNREKALRVEG
jgi:hypothetical protein